MTLLESALLGLVQGIAEFLPISSTGHLILVRELLHIETDFGLAVDATFHFATAFAVLIYFRKDLISLLIALIQKLRGIALSSEMNTLFWALAIGTIPAVVAGLFLESYMDTTFRDPHLVAWILIAGSLLFVAAEFVSHNYTNHSNLTVQKGVMVGFFQALALFPGMSRSGATISGGMLLGLSRERAARFAFLLSFPIILGAGSKKVFELGSAGIGGQEWFTILVGASVAFFAGIASIHFLLRFLKHNSLYVFVVYRVAVALLVFTVV